MNQGRARIGVVVSAPFEENTYIAYFDGKRECLLVDPGLEPEKILQALDAQKLTPVAILITHGHSDHIAGNRRMKERFPACPIVIGRLEAPKLTDPMLNLSGAFGASITSPPADILLDEGDIYSAAGFDLEVRDVPGHSSGHVVFVWHDGDPKIVFGGDVLFAGSIGRTDFPEGSLDELVSGIQSKLFTLPDDTQVLPGHGPVTTILEEKHTNPYVGVPAGYHD